jgi:hypothetical protein
MAKSADFLVATDRPTAQVLLDAYQRIDLNT